MTDRLGVPSQEVRSLSTGECSAFCPASRARIKYTLVGRRAINLDDDSVLDDRAYLVDAGNNLTGYSQTLAEINVLTGAVSVYNTFTDRVAGQTTVTGSSTSQQLLQHDPLGSVRGVSTGTPGAWSHNRVDYTAFGTPFIPGTSTPIESNAGAALSSTHDSTFIPGAEGSLTSFAFTGERRDQVRQYHRARWLTPTRGSWLSQDPVFDWPRNMAAQAGYVGQAPTLSIDPSGMFLIGAQTAVIAKWTIGLIGISIAAPVVGLAYMSIRGRISFVGVIQKMTKQETWNAAAANLIMGSILNAGIGGVTAVATERVMQVLTEEALKRIASITAFLFALIGAIESIIFTYRLVSGELPPGNAETFVAVTIASILLASVWQKGFRRWRQKGAHVNSDYFDFDNIQNRKWYEDGQRLLSSELYGRLGGNSFDAVVYRGRVLDRAGIRGFHSAYEKARGVFDLSVNSIKGFNPWASPGMTLGQWLGSGPTPVTRPFFASGNILASVWAFILAQATFDVGYEWFIT